MLCGLEVETGGACIYCRASNGYLKSLIMTY
jgi:hypothetical protein